jgi:hypothetical protein
MVFSSAEFMPAGGVVPDERCGSALQRETRRPAGHRQVENQRRANQRNVFLRQDRQRDSGKGHDRKRRQTENRRVRRRFAKTRNGDFHRREVRKIFADNQTRGRFSEKHFFLHAVNLGENVRVSPKSIIEKTKSYTINITYPEFSGAADYSKLNAFVLQTINDKVREFKTGEHGRDCAENVKGGGRACSLTGEYSVVHMSPELVSLAYSDNLDLGGAHGTPADHAINFDLKNGKPVQLADVFKPGADYLKTIAAYSISELKKFEGFKDHPQTVEEGAAPKAENYQTWFLSPKGLIVGFAAYQVGAYAYGTPYVTIPFSELRDAMKTDGVAANLMK